jgi:RimJ/RimL family protein N-acetyltransferase
VPPTDATAHTATASGASAASAASTASAGTASGTAAASAAAAGHDQDPVPCTTDGGTVAGSDSEDTLDLRLPDELVALFAAAEPEVPGAHDDLLGRVADWGPAVTPAGVFDLVPVRVERDLPLLTRWMNDPAVAEFWQLAGPPAVTESHLRAQLSGDGRSVPCLGVLEGTPMSYWEIYRADLDPIARHVSVRPHDIGIHLLIGEVADRGRTLGGTLLRAVADLALDKQPACARVVAEPDLRNTPSIAAFLSAGFRFSAEVDLPAKRAALMIRDRASRHLL